MTAKSGEPELSISVSPIRAAARADFENETLCSNVLVDPDYRTWGLAVIRWSDGKYHGYYARWPKESGHKGWMTHCEIAHAVADKPEGPFKTIGAVLEPRNVDGWDVVNSHNPYVVVADGKICLYYISNNLRGADPASGQNAGPSDEWLEENRKRVRDSQCIGVAIADRPEGPFIRSPGPVVEPHGNFKNIAVNPAVEYQNGQFVMIMKGDDARKEGVFRVQLAGHADKPEGPFKFKDTPVYAEMQTEDAGLWFDKTDKRYYMVCHVMGQRDLALFTSKDSHHWKPASTPVLMKKEILLDDGSVWKPHRLERPFVLTDDQGQPVMIYVAVSDNDINGNIAVPIRVESGP